MQTSGIYPGPVGSASLGGEPGNWRSNRLSGVGVGESQMLEFNNKYCSEDPSPPWRCPVLPEVVRFGLLRATGNPTPAPTQLNTQVGLKIHTDGEESSRSHGSAWPAAPARSKKTPQAQQARGAEEDVSGKKQSLRVPPCGATELVGQDREERAGPGAGEGRG